MLASDYRALAVKGRHDPMRHDIFDLGMLLLVIQSLFHCRLYYGLCNTVWEMLLQASSRPQHPVLIIFPECNNFFYHRAGIRQRACFIKNDRIGMSEAFKMLSAFYDNTAFGRLSHGAYHTDRSCYLYRA